MRIIAGKYRSRIIKSLSGDNTRPTTDKVKEALFNTIGPYFEDVNLLDLFAGSGNIGFEALSRGMKSVVFVDNSFPATMIIKENAQSLNVSDQVKIIKADYKTALKRFVDVYKFDYVYIDPPYKSDFIESIINDLNTKALLNANALIIIETLKENNYQDRYDDIIKTKEVVYGISKLIYYKKEEKR